MEQDLNPYQPPSCELIIEETVVDFEPASKGRRFGTLVVDYACFMLFALFVGVSIGLIFGQRGVAAIHKIPDYIFGAGILVFYYIVFEGLWARTPGKWIFGTIVVSETGTRASLKQIAGRTVCRLIPFDALSFFGARGWHDRLSGTQVMRRQ